MALLDRTNLRLLATLQKNGRTSISDLARILERGESTIRERVVGLEREGILTGYHADVNPQLLGLPIRALLRAECDPPALPEVAKHLAAIPNVTRASFTTGEKPVRIEIYAANLEELQRIVEQRIASPYLRRIETGLVLQTLVPRRPIPLTSTPAWTGRATLEAGADHPIVPLMPVTPAETDSAGDVGPTGKDEPLDKAAQVPRRF